MPRGLINMHTYARTHTRLQMSHLPSYTSHGPFSISLTFDQENFYGLHNAKETERDSLPVVMKGNFGVPASRKGQVIECEGGFSNPGL